MQANLSAASSAQVIPAQFCSLVKFPQSPERTATSYPGCASVPDAFSVLQSRKSHMMQSIYTVERALFHSKGFSCWQEYRDGYPYDPKVKAV